MRSVILRLPKKTRMFFDRSTMRRSFLLNRLSSLTVGIVTIFLVHESFGQDIVFPDDNDVPHIVIQQTTVTEPPSTTPVITKANRCPENMVLINENGTLNFCECLEGYLYYQEHDKCYRQYTRGPCSAGSHFIVKPDEETANCVENPCQRDDEVIYEGACHGLLVSGGPCKSDETLVIPDNGYEPICQGVETVNYQLITAPKKRCAPGSRRAADGLCRMKL